MIFNKMARMHQYLIKRIHMPPESKYVYQFRQVCVIAESKKAALHTLYTHPLIKGEWVYNPNEIKIKRVGDHDSNPRIETIKQHDIGLSHIISCSVGIKGATLMNFDWKDLSTSSDKFDQGDGCNSSTPIIHISHIRQHTYFNLPLPLECRTTAFKRIDHDYIMVLPRYCGKLMLLRETNNRGWDILQYTNPNVVTGSLPNDPLIPPIQESDIQAIRRVMNHLGIVAATANIYSVADYNISDGTINRSGAIYVADISELSSAPNCNIKIALFDKLPRSMTYPSILPVIVNAARECGFEMLK